MSEETAPVVTEAPVAVKKTPPVAVKKAEPKKAPGGFIGLDEDTVHRQYFIPPVGHTPPTFPTKQ